MKHPRVWAAALLVAAAPVLFFGYALALFCAVPLAGGCFAALDATRGWALLIVGGLLIVAAAMILTAGRTQRA